MTIVVIIMMMIVFTMMMKMMTSLPSLNSSMMALDCNYFGHNEDDEDDEF